jgi:hypothetical protein
MQSEYYDPDTGIIHLWQSEAATALVGSNVTSELGLEDTSFNDVKFKLLSVEYKVKIFCDNLSATGGADNNVQAFNNEERGTAGSIIVGIANKSDTTTFNSLSSFQGTSAWPVHMTSFAALVGNPASFSKTWKPRKVALSNEQNAFINIRQDNSWPGTADDQAAICYASLYIRGVRL